MTEDKQAAKSKLAEDVDAYATGYGPTGDQLKAAPRLYDWSGHVVEAAEATFLVVQGTVRGHARIADGTEIRTTPIAWFDRHHRFIRTVNTLYVLGNPEEPRDDD